MKSTNQTVLRWIALLAVAATTGACNLTLSTASSGSPQVLVVTATSDTRPGDTPGQTPDSGPAATPTLEFTPTQSPTATETQPTMTAGQSLSCVKGPHWALFEWVTKIAEGETVTLLAKASEDWEEYYYVRKGDGTECWAFGGSSTKTGDYYSLPVREAPPLPEIELVVTNKTGVDIADIFIREGDAAAWGADKISGLLHPDESFSMTLTAGFYDVLINDFTGGVLYEKHDTPIGADAGTRNLAVDQQIECWVENNHPFDICEMRFRRAGFDWVTVHEAGDPVPNGERATFMLLPAFYDVEIYRCTGPMVNSYPNVLFNPTWPGIGVS